MTAGRSVVELSVNGRKHEVWVFPHQTLLEVLREELGASEVKYGCGEGVCGTCTVLLDGQTVNSCLMYALQAVGSSIVTLKGLPGEPAGGSDDVEGDGLHPLQRSFLEHGASQCGFCTPGMVLTAYEFVRDHPSATREQIRAAVAGNLCRCTGYMKIVDAVEAYARSVQGNAP